MDYTGGGAPKKPTADDAVFLCSLLSCPPLEQMQKGKKLVEHWEGVPQTPKARRDPRDKRHWTVQEKLECAMHLQVTFAETKDMQALGIATGYIRSAWEDIQQSRRILLAGKQSRKLDHVPLAVRDCERCGVQIEGLKM